MIYWIAVAALPVHSIYPATLQALVLQVSFVFMVWLSAKVILDMFNIRRMPAANQRNIPYSSSLIWVAISLSIFGLAALTYDKLFIQGINYSDGLAIARQEWRQFGEDREGRASSAFSVVGYLFGSAYYVAAVLAVTQGAVLSARTRLRALLVSFLLLMANSVITGGRSNILLIAVFVFAAFGSRRGISLRGLIVSPLQRRLLQSLVLIAVAYSLLIFYQRADAQNIGGVEYAIDFLPFLGLEADTWYRQSLVDTPLSSISAIAVLAGSYLTHGFASLAAIVDAPPEDKSLIFLNVAQLLYKMGIASQPDADWFLVGRFATFPGALLHQFGPFGFFAGSILLGATAGATKVWVARKPDHLLPLGAYTMMTTTLILTSTVFAPDFLSFPFVAAAFVILAIVGKLIHLRDALRSKGRNAELERADPR